jgi:hypothetical protein
MTYGQPSHRLEHSGKKRLPRNDFMGGVYQEIVNKVQNELIDMPTSIDQEIPIYQKEQALYSQRRV